jgi:hypothetical protein
LLSPPKTALLGRAKELVQPARVKRDDSIQVRHCKRIALLLSEVNHHVFRSKEFQDPFLTPFPSETAFLNTAERGLGSNGKR